MTPASRFKTLLRREYWENRGGFVWAPIITGAIAVLFAIIGAIGGSYALHQARNSQNPPEFNLGPGETNPMAMVADGALLGGISLALMVMVFVVFFYLLGSLYDERRDRSVLFWKSLPVSDTETVLSKLAWATVLAPLLALAIGIGIGLVMWLVILVASLLNGVPGAGSIFTDTHPIRLVAQVLGTVPVYTAWSLPTVGWLMLCSAWAKRFPFLWAVLLPILACALVSMSGGIFSAVSGADFPHDKLWYVVAFRGLASLIPLMWYFNPHVDHAGNAHLGGPQDVAAHVDLTTSWTAFATVDMWVGIVAGIAMIALAIRLRRWRDEG
ncbi:MAG: ABC transporter permease [Lysobacter sp.]|nr:ABC transporter permease [Lysobacter sp.]